MAEPPRGNPGAPASDSTAPTRDGSSVSAKGAVGQPARVGRAAVAARRNRLWAFPTLGFVFAALVVATAPRLDRADALRVPAGLTWDGPEITLARPVAVPDPEAADDMRRRIERRHSKVFLFDPRMEAEARTRIQRLMAITRSMPENMPDGQAAALLRQRALKDAGAAIAPETAETLLRDRDDARLDADLATLLRQVAGRGLVEDRPLVDAARSSGRLTVRSLAAPTTSALTTPGTGGGAGAGMVSAPPMATAADDDITSVFQAGAVLGYPAETFKFLESSGLPGFRLTSGRAAAYTDILRQVLRPNLAFDAAETNVRLRAALGAVDPVRSLATGQRLLTRGDRVTPFQAAAMAVVADETRRDDLLRALGAVICTTLVVAFVALYMRQFHRDLGFTPRTVLMVAMPVVAALGIGRLAVNLGAGPVLGAYAFPAGAVGMLGVMLVDARFALVLTVAACALFGVANGLQFPYAFACLAGGLTGVGGLARLKERDEVYSTGLAVALTNVASFLAVGLLVDPSAIRVQTGVRMAGAAANGFACLALVFLSIRFVFEPLFRITTDIGLLKLVSGRHPLLRAMQEKAPGSFQHSMNVAELAEAAADAVGARALVVRAGAYFHDVGKMLKPKYFTENQTTPEERGIHRKLSPNMSTLIIRNHVRDGAALARNHRLPDLVVDIVRQHHGSGLIQYFHNEALKRADDPDLVLEEDFRYPGPKPQTVEAGIVMLADVVDATSTARFGGAGTVDEADIRRLVNDAVADKFHDGQLDECDLTLADLQKIRESLAKGLLVRYHTRIDYQPAAPRTREKPAAEPAAV